MQEDNIDLLDIEKNFDFLFDIIKGKEENFFKLESWYKEKNINKPFDSYKEKVFRLIEFAYLQNKEKNKNEKEILTKKDVKNQNTPLENTNLNINLEIILKQINELKQNDEQKTKIINELKQNDEQNTKIINELKQNDEQKTGEIMILKENEKSIKKDQNLLNIKNCIMEFINDVQNYINKENIYYNEIRFFCFDKKSFLKNVDICILKSLTIDLYSFKNLCIYRKISYLLLSEIITEKKDFLKYNGIFKSTNKDKDLENTISFFFWVKQSISKLIHFSMDSKLFYDRLIKPNQDKQINLKDIEKIKNTNDYLEQLKDCTYEKLIECLGQSTPLLLFNENTFKKETIENNINNLLSKVEIGKRYNIDSNILCSKLFDLKTQLKTIKEKIEDLKTIEDDNLIKKFNENAEYVEQKTISENEFDKLKTLQENIKKGIETAQDYKKSIKMNYFTFKDFTDIFINDNQIKLKLKEKFNPIGLCAKILSKRLKNKVNFSQDENERLEDILEKPK